MAKARRRARAACGGAAVVRRSGVRDGAVVVRGASRDSHGPSSSAVPNGDATRRQELQAATPSPPKLDLRHTQTPRAMSARTIGAAEGRLRIPRRERARKLRGQERMPLQRFRDAERLAQFAIDARILCVDTGCGAIRAELGSLSGAYVSPHLQDSPLPKANGPCALSACAIRDSLPLKTLVRPGNYNHQYVGRLI